MRRLELTLPTPAENLALDEALLATAPADTNGGEVLRLWESPEPFVVIGRSSQLANEVNCRACQSAGIPVLRRASGGAAIVTGPGCLMYAVVLSIEQRPELAAIDRAHCFVLTRMATALRSLAPSVTSAGTSDLAWAAPNFDDANADAASAPHPGPDGRDTGCELNYRLRKFSGNSMRAQRTHLLYHGTLLYNFDLTLVETYLRMPPRQPEYRSQRAHTEFVANLPVERGPLRDAIFAAWNACDESETWPQEHTARLVAEKYGRRAWHEKL